MKISKVLLLSLCIVGIILTSVLGTFAYLTSKSSIVNTFTVGNVRILLNETKVTADGKPVNGADRVTENNYHLVPGMTYIKDPRITVIKGSEESYVRMLVTINCYSALTSIFGEPFLPQYFVSGWDPSAWISTEIIAVNSSSDTATYEFRYKHTVKPAENDDLVLEPLFETMTVPGTMSNSDMASIADLKITVIGQAIQAAGFTDADTAWSAFASEIGG